MAAPTTVGSAERIGMSPVQPRAASRWHGAKEQAACRRSQRHHPMLPTMTIQIACDFPVAKRMPSLSNDLITGGPDRLRSCDLWWIDRNGCSILPLDDHELRLDAAALVVEFQPSSRE